MPPPYANTLKVVAEFTVGNEIQANVWHVSIDTPVAFAADAALIAAEFETFYKAATSASAPNRGIGSQRHQDHVLSRIVVTDLRVANGDTFELPVVSGAGLHTSTDMLPQNVAALLSLRTALNTRNGRGRIFLGGMVEQNVADAGSESRWTSTTITDILDAVEDLNDRLGATGLSAEIAVLSEVLGAHNDLTTARVDAIPRTMKRRIKQLRATYTSRAV